MSTKGKTKDILLNGVIVAQYDSSGNDEQDLEIMQKILKDKGLWKEVKIEEMMFNQAQSFASTANDLYERGISKKHKNYYSFAPFVVNASFSIEVYLKTLHKLYDNNIKGHSLKALYKSLNKNGKAHINTIAEQTRHLYKIEQDKDFEYYLQLLDKAFIEWRYIYEGTSEKVYFLPTIFVIQALDKACIAVKNEKT